MNEKISKCAEEIDNTLDGEPMGQPRLEWSKAIILRHFGAGDGLEEALQEIADPLKFMRQRAEAAGDKLDGFVAVQLANDANYLRGIASKALSAPRSPSWAEALADWIEARTLTEEERIMLETVFECAKINMRREAHLAPWMKTSEQFNRLRNKLLGGPDGNA